MPRFSQNRGMRHSPLVFAALFLAAGCSGAQLKEQQTLIDSLQKQIQEQAGQSKFHSSRILALESEKRDLEAQLNASQDRIGSLEKSNKDLSKSLESNKGQLMTKVRELISEKDSIARKLSEQVKEKLGLKAVLRNRVGQANELAAELNAQLEAMKAEKDKADREASRRLEKAKADGMSLADAVRAEGLGNQVSLVRSGEVFKLTVPDSQLFKPHDAKLTEAGAEELDKLGRSMSAVFPGRALRVEGHHDDTPVKGLFGFGGVSTPWDISTARAAAVARQLTEKGGLDARRVYASGFGEFRPVGPNDTEAGRAANRRIVLVLEPQPELPAPAAPKPEEPPSPALPD